ncbi:MAG: hypothetical protein AB1806_21280 [Acidobacteriota bacterium]
MRRLIRIALTLLVAYAAWQTGAAYWQYLQLQDRLQRLAQSSVNRSEDQVRAAVVQAAADLGVRLDPDQVAVRLGEDSLSIAATYQRRIEYLPRLSYTWTFELRADVWLIPSGTYRPRIGTAVPETIRSVVVL